VAAEGPVDVSAEDTTVAMVGALDRARSRLSPAAVADLCRRLEAGLTKSVTHGSPRALEAALMGSSSASKPEGTEPSGGTRRSPACGTPSVTA